MSVRLDPYPQFAKTPKPQNPKTPKPQNPEVERGIIISDPLMFWGCTIGNKSSHTLAPHIADGEDEELADSLHVSNASLGPKGNGDKVYIEAMVNGS